MEQFEKALVVRIHPEATKFLNENIFGILYDGKILWQIKPIKYVYKDSPYTGMLFHLPPFR